MKSKKKKILPAELHVLTNFVDGEISKETLIQRISGSVDRSVLYFVKCLQFWHIGKMDDKTLYII